MNLKSVSIISFSIIIGFTILSFSLYFSGSVEKNLNLSNQNLTNNLLYIEEAAKYLKMTEDELKAIIVIEGQSEYGKEISYFKVNDKYYFIKSELDLWLIEKSKNHTKFNTVNYSVTN